MRFGAATTNRITADRIVTLRGRKWPDGGIGRKPRMAADAASYVVKLRHSRLSRDGPIETLIFRLPAQALATQIDQQRSDLQRHGIHLLVSPTSYGHWIIGDSHDYSQDARPFNAESVDGIMLDLARDTLRSKLRVVGRWQGVYGAKRHTPGSGAFSITHIDDRTTVALMHSGICMSVGPALAHRHVDVLMDGMALPQWTASAALPATAIA